MHPCCNFRRKFEAHQLLRLQGVHPAVRHLGPHGEPSADTHTGGEDRVQFNRNIAIRKYLFQYLPPAEELAKLSQYKTDYESLAEVEKFVLSLSDLNR